MSIRVQFRRGNTAQTSTFTGAYAEATIDVTKHTIVVHDGSTQGGFPLALESSLNVTTSDASAASSYANSSYLKANSAYLSQNSTGNYANNAYLHANASYLSQNTSGDYANSAFTKANTATTAAATADQRAVTSGSYANSAYAQANTATTAAATADQRAVTSGVYANAAFDIANSASSYANGAFAAANTRYSSSGGTVSGDVAVTGVITVNTNVALEVTRVTTSTNSQITLDSFSTATYRSAKYLAQMTSGSAYHMIELSLIHDGTTVYLTQYGEVKTGSSLGTFDATISTGNLSLLFTPVNAVTTASVLVTNITV